MNNYTDYLSHHGIKGQKWGVRRYQNYDGSYTQAGLKRYVTDGSSIAKKVAIGTAAVAGGAYLAKHPDKAKAIYTAGKKSFANNAPKVGAYVGRKAGKASIVVGKKLSVAGDKMTDALLASAGTIAIAKLADRYSDANAKTEAQKITNKLIRDTGSAGIKSITNSSGSGNKGKTPNPVPNRGQHLGRDISEKIGPPSNGNIDRSSEAWRNLFTDSNGNHRDSDTRAMIKSMANAGYDIEQIDKYLNHSTIRSTQMNNYTDYLSHHGIKGQKWGVRRYQNKDGSYTQAGEKRRLSGYEKYQNYVTKKLGGQETRANVYASKVIAKTYASNKLSPVQKALYATHTMRVTRKDNKTKRDKLEIKDTDSKVTKTVKTDYNYMPDLEIRAKYQTSKDTYLKRVNKSKSGDPYKDAKRKVAVLTAVAGALTPERTIRYKSGNQTHYVSVGGKNVAKALAKDMMYTEAIKFDASVKSASGHIHSLSGVSTKTPMSSIAARKNSKH